MTRTDVRDASQLPGEVTNLLIAWGRGDASALHALLPLVCDELRVMARRYLRRERGDHILQPTALVNEFFLRICKRKSVSWSGRAHFFGFAGQTMRLILVDAARKRDRQKRGGSGLQTVSLDVVDPPAPMAAEISDVEMLDLHAALERLEAQDPRAADVVKLRYFLGMSMEETAAALERSVSTVKRDWQFARLWLYDALRGGVKDDGSAGD